MELQSNQRGKRTPARLGEKLRRIRVHSGLSQGKMLLVINPGEGSEQNRARISQYERMKRVPSLVETRNYAYFAGVPVEVLLNDQLELPPPVITPKFAPLPEAAKGRTKKSSRRRKSGGKQSVKSAQARITKREANPADPTRLNEPYDAISIAHPPAKIETATGIDEQELFLIHKAEINAEESQKEAAEIAATISLSAEEPASENELSILPPETYISSGTERITLELPTATLDALDDLRLEVLRELPRSLREQLTTNRFINFYLNVALAGAINNDHRNELMEAQMRTLIAQLISEQSLPEIAT